MDQINMFELLTEEKFKITKPIRLIELFAGIGSQAKALQNINADFEHYKVVEFDKYAIESYNAIHNTYFETSDITQIKASDLEIVDTEKYCYIMTYSFPCQDLSKAGLGKGMTKGSDTRSGLLWEVERLLDECNELPQVLVMENVPKVIGSQNIKDFNLWTSFLSSKGYSNYIEILNSKDYGIPQNRKRCFMVSILGDYYYKFPRKIKLEKKLIDFLETEVDMKYFISQKLLDCFMDMTNRNGFIRGQRFKPHDINHSKHSYTLKTSSEAWIVSEEDTDIEKAYKFLIKGLMSHGFRLTEKSGWKSDVIGRETSYGVKHWNELPDLISMAFNRLKNVQIEHQDALKLIDRYSHKDIFIYVDPPYVLSTRTRKQYKHEMTDEQHIQLLEKIVANKSKIMISGYDNEIYNRYLKDWHRYEFKTTVEKGHPRTEVIWTNYEIENKLF